MGLTFNMKRYQFEEIVFWLSFIVYMLARIANVGDKTQTFLAIIVALNLCSAIYYAYKDINDREGRN